MRLTRFLLWVMASLSRPNRTYQRLMGQKLGIRRSRKKSENQSDDVEEHEEKEVLKGLDYMDVCHETRRQKISRSFSTPSERKKKVDIWFSHYCEDGDMVDATEDDGVAQAEALPAVDANDLSFHKISRHQTLDEWADRQSTHLQLPAVKRHSSPIDVYDSDVSIAGSYSAPNESRSEELLSSHTS